MDHQLQLFQAPGHVDLNPIMFDFDLENTYHPPAPPVPPVNPHVLTFSGNVTEAEVLEKWQALPSDIRRGKFLLKFKEPVSLQVNRRKTSLGKLVHERKLFVEKHGYLCHTTTTKTGFYFGMEDIRLLVSMEPVQHAEMVEKVRKLANRIHPNAWDDLKAKLQASPADYFSNYGYTVTSMIGKFPDYVIENIRKAFEEKSNYSYDAGGYFRERKTGRDLKVECKLCDDGIFRAWFSSEFPGCANGDYWLLLNPTTAAFKERD